MWTWRIIRNGKIYYCQLANQIVKCWIDNDSWRRGKRDKFGESLVLKDSKGSAIFVEFSRNEVDVLEIN